jgi:peroxiredoxin Q/BCP
MRSTFTRILFLLLIAVLFLAAFSVMHAASTPQAGTTAPEFTLPAQDGTRISLHQLRGQWVVLYFYPKDFTSGCTLEAHNFQRDQQKYIDRKAIVLGVSLDSLDSHKKFCSKESLTFKLLSDGDHKVASLYGSLTNLAVVKFASRNTFIINPEGAIARVFTGVDPKKHSDEVLSALDQLQAAQGRR